MVGSYSGFSLDIDRLRGYLLEGILGFYIHIHLFGEEGSYLPAIPYANFLSGQYGEYRGEVGLKGGLGKGGFELRHHLLFFKRGKGATLGILFLQLLHSTLHKWLDRVELYNFSLDT